MKITKKILALVCLTAITLIAFAMPVGADSNPETAIAISSGKSVSTTFSKRGDNTDYKITVKSAGTLKLSIEAQMEESSVRVYDSDGNRVSFIDNTTTYGCSSSIGYELYCMDWDSTAKKYKGTVSYSVKAGTYYINFKRGNFSYLGSNKLTFTATFPSESTKKAKVSYININLEKGDTLSLGATVSNGGTVTWKSSNSSVVSVTSTGKITAKAKGTAIITAKCGTSTKKVKIVVS